MNDKAGMVDFGNRCGIAVLALQVCIGPLHAQVATNNISAGLRSLSLCWDPSPTPGVTGYFLCTGPASGLCTNRLDVGNVTNGVIWVTPDLTSFFCVIAYNDLGDESPPSNELVYTPNPPAPVLSLASQTGGGFSVLFDAVVGGFYALQVSEDLVIWTDIAFTNSTLDGPVLFGVRDQSLPKQFFRIVIR